MGSHVRTDGHIDDGTAVGGIIPLTPGIAQDGIHAQCHGLGQEIGRSGGCDVRTRGNAVVGVLAHGGSYLMGVEVGGTVGQFTAVVANHDAHGVGTVVQFLGVGAEELQFAACQGIYLDLTRQLVEGNVGKHLHAVESSGILEVDMVGVDARIHDAGHDALARISLGQPFAPVYLVNACGLAGIDEVRLVRRATVHDAYGRMCRDAFHVVQGHAYHGKSPAQRDDLCPGLFQC